MQLHPIKLIRSSVLARPLLVLAFAWTSLAWLAGSAYAASASGSVGISVRNTIPEGNVGFEDDVPASEERTGFSIMVFERMPTSDNVARARASGDLAYLSAATSAYGYVATDVNGASSGNGRTELRDKLTFDIPAGAYPDGAIARFTGRVSGSSSGVGGGSLFMSYLVRAASGGGGAYQVTDSLNGPSSVDLPFQFDYPLVAPGSTLPSDTFDVLSPFVRLVVSASSLPDQHTWGSAGISLNHMTLEVSDPRVSWSSESGVYTGLEGLPVPGLGPVATGALIAVLAGLGIRFGWVARGQPRHA